MQLAATVTDGLLAFAGDLPQAIKNKGKADFPAALQLKSPLIHKAAETLLDSGSFESMRKHLADFRERNAWVEESALFDCLRREKSRVDKPWWEWEADLRSREASALQNAREQHKRDMDVFVATQFIFDEQWLTVKVRQSSQSGSSMGAHVVHDAKIHSTGRVLCHPHVLATCSRTIRVSCRGMPMTAVFSSLATCPSMSEASPLMCGHIRICLSLGQAVHRSRCERTSAMLHLSCLLASTSSRQPFCQ